ACSVALLHPCRLLRSRKGSHPRSQESATLLQQCSGATRANPPAFEDLRECLRSPRQIPKCARARTKQDRVQCTDLSLLRSARGLRKTRRAATTRPPAASGNPKSHRSRADEIRLLPALPGTGLWPVHPHRSSIETERSKAPPDGPLPKA